jgi:hypothetical protein
MATQQSRVLPCVLAHPLRAGVALGLGAAGLLALGALPVGAGAAAPAKTTFTLTGSVSGKFSMSNGPCSEIGGYGGQFDFYDKAIKGATNGANEWVVNVNALNGKKNGGTYTKFGGLTGNGVSVVFDGSNGKTAYYWASKSGKLTTTKTSGSLSVNLVPDQSFVGKPGKGDIHISGSWGCLAE